METFSALLALCAGNSPVTDEFPAQRPVTRSFDVFFDLRLNKRLSKQLGGWWYQTPSHPLWRHRNALGHKDLPSAWHRRHLDAQKSESCHLSLAALGVVALTTSGAANDDNVGIMTTLWFRLFDDSFSFYFSLSFLRCFHNCFCCCCCFRWSIARPLVTSDTTSNTKPCASLVGRTELKVE